MFVGLDPFVPYDVPLLLELPENPSIAAILSNTSNFSICSFTSACASFISSESTFSKQLQKSSACVTTSVFSSSVVGVVLDLAVSLDVAVAFGVDVGVRLGDPITTSVPLSLLPALLPRLTPTIKPTAKQIIAALAVITR